MSAEGADETGHELHCRGCPTQLGKWISGNIKNPGNYEKLWSGHKSEGCVF